MDKAYKILVLDCIYVLDRKNILNGTCLTQFYHLYFHFLFCRWRLNDKTFWGKQGTILVCHLSYVTSSRTLEPPEEESECAPDQFLLTVVKQQCLRGEAAKWELEQFGSFMCSYSFRTGKESTWPVTWRSAWRRLADYENCHQSMTWQVICLICSSALGRR